ncbi:MAG: hypothetical protein FJZ10_02795 [Candidatus Omnitrophica bacterium]|nr:hypothetical protein [Candidatus Omnitrophota bacterium]
MIYTMNKKFIVLVITIVIVLFSLSAASACYFLLTSKGSGFITKFALSKFAGSNDIQFAQAEGMLARKLSIYDIEIKNIKGLSGENVLKIQRLDIYFASFGIRGLNIEVDNGRLRLADSDAILFYGKYIKKDLDFNVYSRRVDIGGLRDLFSANNTLENLSGSVSDLDVSIKGALNESKLIGNMQIDKLAKNGFSMIGCPVSFKIDLKDISDKLELHGEVVLKSGTVQGPKTKAKLSPSKIIFSGDPMKPRLDVRAISTIERVKIDIELKGTIEEPDLKLTSEPARSQERLLIMLATGKSWTATETSLFQQKPSLGVAKDFIDYFILGGQGSNLASKLGISDVSLKYEKQTKGIEAKKMVTDKTSVIYGIEQEIKENDSQGKKETQSTITQKIGGEYNITDNISVGGEKELKSQQQNKNIQQPQQEADPANDKIYLKYKTEF